MITAAIKLAGSTIRAEVDFVIATGNTHTTISEADAEKIHFPTKEFLKENFTNQYGNVNHVTPANVEIIYHDNRSNEYPQLVRAHFIHQEPGQKDHQSVIGIDALAGMQMTISAKRGIVELRPSTGEPQQTENKNK